VRHPCPTRRSSDLIEEVAYLSNPGRGVLLMKLAPDDALIGMLASPAKDAALEVKTSLGGTQRVGVGKYEETARGGKGKEVMKRGSFVEVVRSPLIALPPLAELPES